jgi:hypothetical protein
MDEAGISRVGATLGVVLPASYSRLLSVYPFSKYSAGVFMVNGDSAWLITRNGERRDSSHRSKQNAPSLATGHLLIGTDGSEKEYLIDLNNQEPGVIEYCLETGEAKPFAASISEYVRIIEEIDKKVEEEEVAGEERAKQIPKWRHTLKFYLPAAIALFFCFTVLPLLAFAISRLWKWIAR